MVFIAAGLIWFGQVSVGGSFLTDILGPSLLAAIGLGLAFVPITIAAVSGVDEHEAGLASGLINTSQQVGGALGLAILATVANTTTNNVSGSRAHALTEGFQTAFLAGAGFAILGLIVTLVLISNADSRAHVALGSGEPSGRYSSLTSASTSPTDSFASPNSIAVLSGRRRAGCRCRRSRCSSSA